MIRIRIIILLLTASICFAQVETPQTNVVVALSGVTSGEPHLEDSFILGYESAGGTYTGTFTILENTSTVNGFKYADTNNAQLVLRNTGTSNTTSKQIDSFYAKGIQFVTCNGSNGYHSSMGTTNGLFTNTVICGGGLTNNMTGTPIEFYGVHFGYDFPIVSMVQGTGDTLTITVNTATNGVFFVNNTYRVTFSGVSGFSNNPNGEKQVVKQVSNGLFNSFTIIHNAGTGSFSSGNVSVFYQSYSHAYIGGQLTYIKDQLGCTWWEARYRARVTGSESNVYDATDGYGSINIASAIAYSGSIPADPYDSLGYYSGTGINVTRSGNTASIYIDSVSNALKYEIYNRDSLLQTIFAVSYSTGAYNFNVERQTHINKYKFYYVAIRDEEKLYSDTTTMNFVKYLKFYYND